MGRPVLQNGESLVAPTPPVLVGHLYSSSHSHHLLYLVGVWKCSGNESMWSPFQRKMNIPSVWPPSAITSGLDHISPFFLGWLQAIPPLKEVGCIRFVAPTIKELGVMPKPQSGVSVHVIPKWKWPWSPRRKILNIAPGNRPSQKEMQFSNHTCRGDMLCWGGVIPSLCDTWLVSFIRLISHWYPSFHSRAFLPHRTASPASPPKCCPGLWRLWRWQPHPLNVASQELVVIYGYSRIPSTTKGLK